MENKYLFYLLVTLQILLIAYIIIKTYIQRNRLRKFLTEETMGKYETASINNKIHLETTMAKTKLYKVLAVNYPHIKPREKELLRILHEDRDLDYVAAEALKVNPSLSELTSSL
jgi:hypothetical protein